MAHFRNLPTEANKSHQLENKQNQQDVIKRMQIEKTKKHHLNSRKQPSVL